MRQCANVPIKLANAQIILRGAVSYERRAVMREFFVLEVHYLINP